MLAAATLLRMQPIITCATVEEANELLAGLRRYHGDHFEYTLTDTQISATCVSGDKGERLHFLITIARAFADGFYFARHG